MNLDTGFSSQSISWYPFASSELGKSLYEEAAKRQAASSAPKGQIPPPEGEVKRKGGDDDVIDAKFEAKDR